MEALRAGETRTDVATLTKPLDIPDLEAAVKPIPGIEAEDPQQELHALIEVGKLHFHTGELELAETAFNDALKMDPLNAAAKDYLERIRKEKQLEVERQGTIKVIERILGAEKGPSPE